MRVIGGTAKGKKLKSVPGEGTRPILDRIKVPLFDILRPKIANMRVLDLFAGTGAVGIEALSQGAEHCVFLDLNAKAVQTIKENLDNAGLTSKAEVKHMDAFGYLKRVSKSFDLIYVAPPQYEGLWIEAVRTIAERIYLVKPKGQVIVQIDPKEYEKLNLTELEETEQRKYGNTLLVFYERAGHQSGE